MSKHVIVTGAGNGIGAGIARSFAADGFTVSVVDVRADLLAERYDATPEIGQFVADLAAPDAGDVVGRIWDERGPVDVLVNAAGIYPAVPILDIDAATWDRIVNVNARAPMLTTVSFAKRAIAAGRPGAVINLSSGAALRSRPGGGVYSTSKAAVEMVSRAAALELGAHNIRVNTVSPGFVTVNSDVNPVTPEYTAALSGNPLGRSGEPEDIAQAVKWLASDAASWVTGTVIRVDGGSGTGALNLPLHWSGTTPTQSGE